jgi:DNA-binding response OmpR family regulator
MNHKILIVEDDEDIRVNLKMILEIEGYLVSTAHDGMDALTQLRQSSDLPTLIILDLMMPVMNGLQFRKEQEEDPRLAKIPVIITTADGTLESRKTGKSAKIYIKKPYELDRLLDTIDKLAQLSHESGI